MVLERGEPAETILRKAAELGCGLVVTGIARGGTLARAVLGTTVERLVRRAPMPVLVVKNRPHRIYEELVVATDFSESSRHALEQATRLFPGARMVLLHAYRVPFEGFLDKDAHRDEFHQAATEECRTFLAGVDAPSAALGQVECLIEYGSPHELIPAYVWDKQMDLAVLGTHGRSGAFDILLGSTAEWMLSSLPCDILVVREPRSLPAARAEAGAARPGA